MTIQKSLPYACSNRRARWWARQATKLRGFGVPARGNAFIPCRAIQAERGGFRWQMTFGKWPAGFFNCKVFIRFRVRIDGKILKDFFFPSISMTHVLHIPKSVAVTLSCTFGSSCLFSRASKCGCQL